MKNKYFILFIFCLLSSVFHTYADDVIVFRNGDIVNGVVIEITSSEIKYKKASNPKGPTYSTSKADILSIKYENGDTEKFNASCAPDTYNNDTSFLTLPDDDNELQKSLYSTGTYSSSKKISSNQAKSASFFLKFTKASVISSKDLVVKFEPGYCLEGKWYPYNGNTPGWFEKRIANIQYRIHVTNKTNKEIYIDLGRTSKLDEINGFITYYDGSQVINSTNDLSGASVNLGIFSIGGGSSESSTIVQHGNRFITLAQHATFIIPAKQKFLPSYKDPYIYFETFTNYEEVVPFANKFSNLRERESKYYDETDSPIKVNYKLTYSFDRDFTNLQEMDFSLYAYQVIGLPMLWDKWWGSFRDTFKNFKGLDDTFIGGSIMFEK